MNKKNLFLMALAMLMAVPVMAGKTHSTTLPNGTKIGGRTSFTFDGSDGYLGNLSLTYYKGTNEKSTATGKAYRLKELSKSAKGGGQVWYMPAHNLVLLYDVNLTNVSSLAENTSGSLTIVVQGTCSVSATGSKAIVSNGTSITITSLCGIKGTDSKTSPYLPTTNKVFDNDKAKSNRLTLNKPIESTKWLSIGTLTLDVRSIMGGKDASLFM